MKTIPETITAEGAHNLRERIKTYWRNRGFREPHMFTVKAHSPNQANARYDVRSTMVGGWPT